MLDRIIYGTFVQVNLTSLIFVCSAFLTYFWDYVSYAAITKPKGIRHEGIDLPCNSVTQNRDHSCALHLEMGSIFNQRRQVQFSPVKNMGGQEVLPETPCGRGFQRFGTPT